MKHWRIRNVRLDDWFEIMKGNASRGCSIFKDLVALIVTIILCLLAAPFFLLFLLVGLTVNYVERLSRWKI